MKPYTPKLNCLDITITWQPGYHASPITTALKFDLTGEKEFSEDALILHAKQAAQELWCHLKMMGEVMVKKVNNTEQLVNKQQEPLLVISEPVEKTALETLNNIINGKTK